MKSINFLKNNRDSIFIIALPSSVYSLFENNIKPDIILQTDPGFYTIYHLNYYSNYKTSLALTLNSNFKSKIKNRIIISNNSDLENKFINYFKIPHYSTPSNGTVAANALFLAKSLTSFPIYFAGLDFSYNDIFSHVVPHESDNFYNKESNKLKSYLTYRYKDFYNQTMKHNYGQSFALQTYSNWFKRLNTKFTENTFRLFPNEIDLPFKNVKLNHVKSNLNRTNNIINKISFKLDQLESKTFLENYLKSTIKDLKKLNSFENLKLNNLIYFVEPIKFLDVTSKKNHQTINDLKNSAILFFDSLLKSI